MHTQDTFFGAAFAWLFSGFVFHIHVMNYVASMLAHYVRSNLVSPSVKCLWQTVMTLCFICRWSQHGKKISLSNSIPHVLKVRNFPFYWFYPVLTCSSILYHVRISTTNFASLCSNVNMSRPQHTCRHFVCRSQLSQPVVSCGRQPKATSITREQELSHMAQGHLQFLHLHVGIYFRLL